MDVVGRAAQRAAGWRLRPIAFGTLRTWLRPLSPGDETLYCALYTSPEVMAHIGCPLPGPVARQAFLAACRLNAVAGAWQRRWAVLDARSGEGLGMLALMRDADDPVSAELGVMLLPAAQRQGLARELDDAVALHAFAPGGWGLQRLWARHAPGHAAAAGVLAASGFEPGDPMGAAATRVLTRGRWLALRA